MRGATKVTIAFVLLCLNAEASAQRAKSRGTRPAATKKAAPVDPIKAASYALATNSVSDQSKLYEACAGSNVKALLFGLEGIKQILEAEKGEFETQAAFDARVAGLSDVVNGGRQMIVCQGLDDNEDVPFRYNADKEVFTGSFDKRLRADLDWKKTGTYVSRTRMGTKATVESFLDIEYIVDMSSSPRRSNGCAKSDYLGKTTFEVAVPRAIAPNVKANGYLVILGKLKRPFFEETRSPGSPTLDHPKDIYEVGMHTTMNPEALVIVTPDEKQVWKCDLE